MISTTRLNFTNRFNRPSYNNSLAGLSSNYNFDNFKDRLSFNGKDPCDLENYHYEPFRTSQERCAAQTAVNLNVDQSRAFALFNPIRPGVNLIQDFIKDCMRIKDFEIDNTPNIEFNGCTIIRKPKLNVKIRKACSPSPPFPFPDVHILPPEEEDYLIPIPIPEDPPQETKNPQCNNCLEGRIYGLYRLQQILQWMEAKKQTNQDGILCFAHPTRGLICQKYTWKFNLYRWSVSPTAKDQTFEAGVPYFLSDDLNDLSEEVIKKRNQPTDCKYPGFWIGLIVGSGGLEREAMAIPCEAIHLDYPNFLSKLIGIKKTENGLIGIYREYDPNFEDELLSWELNTESPQTPKIPKNASTCFYAWISLFVEEVPYDPDAPPPSGTPGFFSPDVPIPLPPPSYPPPKPRQPMQACTCQQVERLLQKYLNVSVKGKVNSVKCAENPIIDFFTDESHDFDGKGLDGIKKAIESLGKAQEESFKELCKQLLPEIKGEIESVKCNQGNPPKFRYEGRGILGIARAIEAMEQANKRNTIEVCEGISDIKIGIEKIPERVQLQLADEFSLILERLREILRKLDPQEPGWLEQLLKAIALIADILGIITGLKSLLESQPDYRSDFEFLKQITQELKTMLSVQLQGKIDAIQCNGEIISNSWGAQGLEGLNQAITALGINLAVLHADLCQKLDKEQEDNRLQGKIDAITCEGEIISNSWDGHGFDGINQAITAIGVSLATLHADLCQLFKEELKPPILKGKIDAIRCDQTVLQGNWEGEGWEGLNQAITVLGNNLAILHADLCELDYRKKLEITDKFQCGKDTIKVEHKIDKSAIAEEVKFLYERMKVIEMRICDLKELTEELKSKEPECNAVPVFPGDSIEEREIPAQAVITFVEASCYPKIKGSLWHLSIPYPVDDLIKDKDCWAKFENLTLRKGNVLGRIIWKSPNNTINRFYTGMYGASESEIRTFLDRLAAFSKLTKDTIRISTGGSPRTRPQNVTIRAVKVVVLERENGILVPKKCCRVPRP